jgi:hypothetical protein
MPASNLLQAAVVFLAAGSTLSAILGVLPAQPTPGQGPSQDPVEVEQQQTVEPDLVPVRHLGDRLPGVPLRVYDNR